MPHRLYVEEADAAKQFTRVPDFVSFIFFFERKPIYLTNRYLFSSSPIKLPTRDFRITTTLSDRLWETNSVLNRRDLSRQLLNQLLTKIDFLKIKFPIWSPPVIEPAFFFLLQKFWSFVWNEVRVRLNESKFEFQTTELGLLSAAWFKKYFDCKKRLRTRTVWLDCLTHTTLPS